MIKRFIAIVMALGFAAAGQAGVWLDVEVSSNSIGQDLYVISVTSDEGPVTSIGLGVVSAGGDLGQVHPMGIETPSSNANDGLRWPPATHRQQCVPPARDRQRSEWGDQPR